MFNFGGPSTGSQSGTGGSLFSTQPQAPPQTQQPLFGGTGTNAGSSGGLFKFGTGSTFGGSSAGAAGSSANPSIAAPAPFSSGQPASFNSSGLGTLSASTNPSTLVTSLATYPFQYIQQCFDPNHSNYRFRAFFYNVADDLNETQRLERQTTKPPNVSDALWAQVRNDNPDPAHMVPVLANGFSDLHARATWEDAAIKAHTAKLSELHERSARLIRDLDVDLTSKLRAAQQRHQTLSLRLLRIMRGMEVLRRSETKLTAAEADALTRLKTALGRMGAGSLEAANLRTTAFQLAALLDSGRLDPYRSARAIKPASEEARVALHGLLSEQQTHLAATVDALQKDAADLQTIRAGYQAL